MQIELIFAVSFAASGGVDFILDIDLYDPYPDTSRGLVRPFELLTSGTVSMAVWRMISIAQE